MPTYRITAKPGLLDDGQKDGIARQVTRIHAEITGAPHYYVQIIFDESPYRRYVGGEPADSQIWVRADIRSGRTISQRKQLVSSIVEAVSTWARVPASEVWVYLNNMEASDMAEYGKILPEPGRETEWLASLPAELQERLSSLKPLE